MAARERQDHAVLGTGSNCRHHHLPLLGIHVAGRHACRDRTNLHELLLGHAFTTVAQQGVGDLVTHDHGEAVIILRHRNDAGVHRDLAARQAEGVDLVGLDHADLPLVGAPIGIRRGSGGIGKVFFDLRRRFDEALGYALHFLGQFAGADDLGLLQDFLIRLQAKRGLLLRRGVQQLLAPGERSLVAVAEIVVAEIQAKQENRPEFQAAPVALLAQLRRTISEQSHVLVLDFRRSLAVGLQHCLTGQQLFSKTRNAKQVAADTGTTRFTTLSRCENRPVRCACRRRHRGDRPSGSARANCPRSHREPRAARSRG